MTPPSAPAMEDKARRRQRTWLIIDTAVTVLLAPLALFWGLMSGMATTTTSNAGYANAYVLVNLTLPVAMVVCLAGAWVAFAMRHRRATWILMLLPLLWLLVSVTMMAMWPAS